MSLKITHKLVIQIWFDEQQSPKAWRRLHSDSVVFIISDLGQLEQDDTVHKHWLKFICQLHRQNIRPIVLAPLSAAQQTNEFYKLTKQVLWNKHGRLQPQRPGGDLKQHQQLVGRVLGLLSIAVHVEPELLRAILGCLPVHEADSGIEAAVWWHGHIEWGHTAIRLHPSQRDLYQQKFQEEPSHIQNQVLALIKRHHSSQFPGVWVEEIINAAPLLKSPEYWADDIKNAEQFMLRFARSFRDTNDSGMAQYARRHLLRLGENSTCHYQKTYTSVLYGLAYREQLREGSEIPSKYDAQLVSATIGETLPQTTYSLMQVGEHLEIQPAKNASQHLNAGSVLTGFVAVSDTLTLQQDNTVHVIKIQQPIKEVTALCHLQGQPVTLDTGLQKLTLTGITKPLWAVTIGNDRQGLFAKTQSATGEHYRYYWHPPIAEAQNTACPGFWYPGKNIALPWHIEQFGRDAFGLFADLTFKGITQRFRWIQPGAFLMGSPEEEPERYNDETQHHVILSQGYWLADTACTQALWQAVMGSNPSGFKNNLESPVEQVSWNAVQEFISKLNKEVHDLNASLPTEAQWEYACRAGTATRYSFGDEISAEQVNYAGNHGKTLPVKSLPANAWGLYEMHGNVWEWCQDRGGKYPTGTATDPIGASKGASRVLRGGAWYLDARRARSADRNWGDPDSRNSFIGFRLALGQTARPEERRAVAGKTAAAERIGQASHRSPEQGSIFSRLLKRIKPK